MCADAISLLCATLSRTKPTCTALLFAAATFASAASLAGGLAGCIAFETTTPAGFVELDDQQPNYDYRAVSADGVVIAVREIKHDPKGSSEFWVTAIRNQMRDTAGYALIEEKKVTTRSGLQGTQLKFGHDQDGVTMLYDVTIFVTKKYIFLLEFGGTKDEMTRNAANLAKVVENFREK